MLLLTFRAAESLYAVDVTRVVEVVPRVLLRRLPHAPAYLAGIFDYRGWVVPVVDLGILLGGRACDDRLSTRIILIDLGNGGRHAEHRTETDPHAPSPADANAPIGEPQSDRRSHSRRRIVGVIAEHVSDVASIKPEQVISPAMNLPQAPYLGAIVDINQQMTQMLVAESLLEPSFREAFFETETLAEEHSGSVAASNVGPQ